MSIILKAENISKQYRLGTVGTGSFGDDLKRWWYYVRGKENPFLKVGAENDRSSSSTEDYVWALRDIAFEVKQGEVLGIIGKNGAGKSTLLKLLSRVTAPTTGIIRTKGRIASLLEIGTGFHPELTGRENIFMNGAVLGMTRSEIKSKLDEIITFSGCERYIDTPTKRYSSGMTVRLGFAVAAHLEPEILVVDEVLAVGDAEFQKKAIGKMQDLSSGEGRTVIFVSHNMVSIQQLCTSCMVLEKGKILYQGNVKKAVTKYLEGSYNTTNSNRIFPIKGKSILIEKFKIQDADQRETNKLIIGYTYSFIIFLQNLNTHDIHLNCRLQIFDKSEVLITTINTFHTNSTYKAQLKERFELECILKKFPLTVGKYSIGVQLINLDENKILYEKKAFYDFEVFEGDFFKSGKIPSIKNLGTVLLDYEWQNSKVTE